ncbi:hypothetical protein [Trujillonella endophytica]|uniref:Secreted protein n=1 Tax=Trujillonella endophytica TaxID=673521 RepID=A0A1H8S095_9ACTN|nr:hypothetical protein [Trujillella endophytica]SEO72359.1 hypothetical protein SAMN05660991_01476 [Trujillella endophytica]
MISTNWTTTPALVAGVLVARPAAAGGACAAHVAAPTVARRAPLAGTRVPAARLRALTGAMPFGAGTAADERHIDDNSTQNKSTLGIHSPGRPLS